MMLDDGYQDDPARPEAQVRPVQGHPTLLELRSGQCRFPIGDRLEPARFFCGSPALTPKPYCRECCQRAYVVSSRR
jgi:hypothetical protein